MIATAREEAGTRKSAFKSAVDLFESFFFSNLVLVLDNLFVHRGRGLEKKDSNPLNEVRMLCNSILQNHGVMVADRAFFAEIEAKFT